MLNKTSEQEQPESTGDYQQQVSQIYTTAAKDYLTCFSENAFKILCQYEKIALQSIEFKRSNEFLEVTKQNYQVQLINTLLENLS
jgi:hypothetical protein